MTGTRVLLVVGTLVAGVLLVRFGLDFGGSMPAWLAAPAWLLVAATIGVAAYNAFRPARASAPAPARGRELATWQRLALVGMVPAGFVASSLDCTGLSLTGCTTTCTLLKTVWFPTLLAACTAAALGKKHAAAAVLALSFLSLLPHCICRNPVNAWWMDRLGQSPMCLGWGFVAGLVALGALTRRSNVWPSLAVSAAIAGGTAAFFVGHHYLHFPW